MTHQAIRVSALLITFAAVAGAAIYPPNPGDLSVEIPIRCRR